jgi:hypothetical protein
MSRLKSALLGAVVAAGLVLAPLPAYGIGALPASSAIVSATPVSLAGFTGMSPTRVLNTTVGLGAPRAKLGAARTLTLKVPGLPVGTTAVAINVMVQQATAAGYLTVYPGGRARPGASNLTFVANQIMSNLVLVPLGPKNTITFYNRAGTVNVFADLVGYYKPGTGGGFTGLTLPEGLFSTVPGLQTKLGAGLTLTLTVRGLPAGTTALALKVSIQRATAASYLTVYPGGRSRPGASNLNFVPNQITSNMDLVPLGPGNTVTFFNRAGTVNVFADLVGYYKPGVGGGFTGMTPTRVLNTVAGLGAAKAKLGQGRSLTLTVPGLPAGTTAVAINVMVQNPTTTGHLTVYIGRTRPAASNLTFVANQTTSSLVLVNLGPGNTVTFFNSAGTVNVFADLVGYYK